MKKKIITVQPIEVGERLDKFLKKQFPNLSRAFLQKLIKAGKITLNNKKTMAHSILKKGVVISAELVKPPEISLTPDPYISLDIIFEDNDFLILNKPAGLAVHPPLNYSKPTLISGILAHFPKISSVGENPLRPGVVHRLDKDVSGVLVVAKNQNSFHHLKKQFQERKIKKKYIALVYGKIIPSLGKIDLNIGRSKRKPYRMSIKQKGEGKTALTYYQTIKTFPNHSLLEIETKTGRTHQIRVHLSAVGHPIVGDRIYQMKSKKRKDNLNRVFLHASFIQFIDPQEEKRTFHTKLPPELNQCLVNLERDPTKVRS